MTWPSAAVRPVVSVIFSLSVVSRHRSGPHPRRRIAVAGPSGSGKTPWPRYCSGSSTRQRATAHSPTPTRPPGPGTTYDRLSACAPRTSTSSTVPCARTSGSPAATAPSGSCGRPWRRHASTPGRALPAGLHTPVGEHGARLSGGRRQCLALALARALRADFPVLVLDEPTEHLDPLTVTRERATVLITHRLSGLEQVDEILVLDHGRMVQRGTWDELAAVPGPLRRTAEREPAVARGRVRRLKP